MDERGNGPYEAQEPPSQPVWVEGRGWTCWRAGRELTWVGGTWRANVPYPGSAPTHGGSRTAAALATIGGCLVATGALLPFVAIDQMLFAGDIRPGVRVAAFLYGLLLAGGSAMLLFDRVKVVFGVLTGCAAAFGVLGYGSFAAMGMVGFEEEGLLGPRVVHWTPGLGLGLSLLGACVCAVAAFAACRGAGEAA